MAKIPIAAMQVIPGNSSELQLSSFLPSTYILPQPIFRCQLGFHNFTSLSISHVGHIFLWLGCFGIVTYTVSVVVHGLHLLAHMITVLRTTVMTYIIII